MKRALLTFFLLSGWFCAHRASGAELFETDWSGGTINKFSPDGTETTFASGLSAPSGLAFDSAGNLYEADEASGNVFKFSSSGAKSTFATGLGQPFGLAFGPNGNLYVSDEFPNKIYSITPSGTVSVLASGSELLEPEGLAFGPNGNLYVADFNRIDEFTTAGVESTYGGADSGAVGLAFSPAGNLFITNDQHNIIEYPLSGTALTFFGTVPGMSSSIAFDSSGNLFVASRGATQIGSSALYEFSPSGVRTTLATGLSNPEIGLVFAAPEPSSVALLGFGGCLALWCIRRKCR